MHKFKWFLSNWRKWAVGEELPEYKGMAIPDCPSPFWHVAEDSEPETVELKDVDPRLEVRAYVDREDLDQYIDERIRLALEKIDYQNRPNVLR